MTRQIATVLATALVSVAALVATGTAAANGTSQVDGIMTLVSSGDPLDSTDDVYWMDGYGGGAPGLVGYWYTRTLEPGVFTPSGVFTSTGTEEFVGCLDADGDRSCDASEPAGTLWFAYEFSGKFDTVTFAEYHARCHHAITAGTGDFAGATGQLHIKDDPETGCSYYSGHVALGDSGRTTLRVGLTPARSVDLRANIVQAATSKEGWWR
jgi:hypothetical protein